MLIFQNMAVENHLSFQSIPKPISQHEGVDKVLERSRFTKTKWHDYTKFGFLENSFTHGHLTLNLIGLKKNAWCTSQNAYAESKLSKTPL